MRQTQKHKTLARAGKSPTKVGRSLLTCHKREMKEEEHKIKSGENLELYEDVTPDVVYICV